MMFYVLFLEVVEVKICLPYLEMLRNNYNVKVNGFAGGSAHGFLLSADRNKRAKR